MQASPDRRSRNRRRRPQQGYMVHSYESNGPDIKIRGTPQTIADKYTQLARDSLGSGDLVLAENYFQHAEHYVRLLLMDESAISSRPVSPSAFDETPPSEGESSESNVTPLEYPQANEQQGGVHQEARSYNRSPRGRDHVSHSNGEGYSGQRDRGRSSSQRYRSSGGGNALRDDSRGDYHKRLDRGPGRDSRRDYENHNRRSWTQTPGRVSEGESVGHEASSSSTFNESGLPAFLAAPVSSRISGSPQPRMESSLEGGTPLEVEKKNHEMLSTNVGDAAPLTLAPMEASES